MDILRLIEESIETTNVIDAVRDPSAGAISTFIGTTRDHFESKFFFVSFLMYIFKIELLNKNALDKRVISLEYEAYPEMAILELEKICSKVTKYIFEIVYF